MLFQKDKKKKKNYIENKSFCVVYAIKKHSKFSLIIIFISVSLKQYVSNYFNGFGVLNQILQC